MADQVVGQPWAPPEHVPANQVAEAAQAIAEASAQAMWKGDMASQHLGMSLREIAPGRAVLQMVVTAPMVNGHGLCHGGYIFSLADSAFAFACNTYGATVVAASAGIDFLSPARVGDTLVASAGERYRHGRSGLYYVTVRRAGDHSIVAEFRGRSRVIAAPATGPASPSAEEP